jgi:hypothetical protein
MRKRRDSARVNLVTELEAANIEQHSACFLRSQAYNAGRALDTFKLR